MPAKRLLIAFSILAFGLGGCGFKDIDNRFFVVAVGIDQGKTHPYHVTLKLAIPSPRTEPGQSKAEYVSQEADTIAEAVRLLKSHVDKELDFGHTKLLLIGKPFTQNRELGKALDWFTRRRDIQQIAYMAIGDPDARSVLEIKPKSERLPGNAMVLSFSSEGTESPHIVTEMLFDFYRRYRNRGVDAYLPIIQAAGKEQFVINRVAVLHDEQVKLILTTQETGLFKQLVRGYPRFLVTADWKGKPFTFAGQQMTRSFRILTNGQKETVIRYNVVLKGEVEDSYVPLFNEPWSEIRNIVADQLRLSYSNLLEKLQKADVDPLGFGLQYRAARHQGSSEYNTWKELYPKVQFRVKVKVKMRGTGIIQ
jgi:spore germination protein KC